MIRNTQASIQQEIKRIWKIKQWNEVSKTEQQY